MRAAIPNTARNPTNEPSDRIPSVNKRPPGRLPRAPSAASGRTAARYAGSRRPPEQHEDADCRGNPEDQQTVLRVRRLLGLAQQFRAVSGGQIDFVEPRVDVIHHFAEAAPGDRESTSMRRSSFSRLMMLSAGFTRTSATSTSRTRSPLGVSIGRFRMSVRLRRVRGVLQTCTSYARAPLKMSPTSSLASSVPAARRTSPGLSP